MGRQKSVPEIGQLQPSAQVKSHFLNENFKKKCFETLVKTREMAKDKKASAGVKTPPKKSAKKFKKTLARSEKPVSLSSFFGRSNKRLKKQK